jgi:hypothetical protein
MTNQERTIKITALMEGKDHLEKGLAVLRMEGYGKNSHVAKRVQCGIDLLRTDIIGLQTGSLPFCTIVKQEAAA